MDFNIIIGLLVVSILVVYLSERVVRPYLEKVIDIRKMDVENTKIELFMKMDPKLAEEEIEKLIEKYLNEYVLKKFIVNNINYIKKEQIETMVRDLDKLLMIEMSELYIFYIKTVTNINNQDDILTYINKKVQEQVLDFSVNFNKEK